MGLPGLIKQMEVGGLDIIPSIGFRLKLLGSIEKGEQIKGEEIFNQIQQQIVDGEEREEKNVEAVSEEQPAFSPFVAPKSQS